MNRFMPLLKIFAIVFLTLLLLIPMVRIQGLIRERQALRDGVVQDIARSAAYAQTLTGPLLIVPYTRKLQEQQLDANQKLVTVTREVAGELRLLPATMDLGGRLDTEERQRGIYRARIFHADTKLHGAFRHPRELRHCHGCGKLHLWCRASGAGHQRHPRHRQRAGTAGQWRKRELPARHRHGGAHQWRAGAAVHRGTIIARRPWTTRSSLSWRARGISR